MNGRVHICTGLQKNTILKALNLSCCGMSDLVAESLARVLAVNTSLEELNIIDNNIRDNGIAHIAKSLQENNTLKVLHVGTTPTQDNRAGLTDTGVLSLARGVAINTSIECFSIQWPLTDPESTLKMMTESIKKSSLKTDVYTTIRWEYACTRGDNEYGENKRVVSLLTSRSKEAHTVTGR